MYKRIVIDRIENNIAICEVENSNGTLEKKHILLSEIDGEVKEGYELFIQGKKYISKRNETKEAEMKRRLNNLFGRTKKSNKGF